MGKYISVDDKILTNSQGQAIYEPDLDSENILENHTIFGVQGSAVPGIPYTAGTGIDITNDEISIDETVVATKTDLENYVEESEIATVAKTGSYNDLANKPTIPVVDYPVADVKVNNTSIVDNKEVDLATNGTYNAITNKIATMSDIPTDYVNVKPNGVNDLLDDDNKIDTIYLPDVVLGQLVFGGDFNADTDTATLSVSAKAKLGTTSSTIVLTNDNTPITGYGVNEGIFYVTEISGTFAGISFTVGD